MLYLGTGSVLSTLAFPECLVAAASQAAPLPSQGGHRTACCSCADVESGPRARSVRRWTHTTKGRRARLSQPFVILRHGTLGAMRRMRRLAAYMPRPGMWRGLFLTWSERVGWRPREAVAHANLGAAYLKLARTKDAVRELQRAVALDPRNAATQSNLGQALMLGGQPKAAAEAFSAAAEDRIPVLPS